MFFSIKISNSLSVQKTNQRKALYFHKILSINKNKVKSAVLILKVYFMPILCLKFFCETLFEVRFW